MFTTCKFACLPAGMLAPDGRCKTLDTSADGYVRAEACVVFSLVNAFADGVPEAVVVLQASFVNQDGRSSSLTAPNGPAQQEVIRGALAAAAILPSDVRALEMHGTGEDCALQQQEGGGMRVHSGCIWLYLKQQKEVADTDASILVPCLLRHCAGRPN